MSSRSALDYRVFTVTGPGLGRNLPPGYESLSWVANSATLIYGERDAVLVDTFLTIEHGVQLAGQVRRRARTSRTCTSPTATATTSSESTRSNSGFPTSRRSRRPPSWIAWPASSSPM